MHDGDTVHLQDGRKVRLIGINAPELARDKVPEQAFAREARASLDAAIASSANRVGLVYGADRHDRYKRTLAHLFTTDGENVQAQLLQQGLASAIAHPPNLAYTECYRRQEQAARCAGAGIWSKPGAFMVEAGRLDASSSGFRLVSGRVERTRATDSGLRIFMENLVLGIHQHDLEAFDQAMLSALAGKQVTVRGWLHPAGGKNRKKEFRDKRGVTYYMRIRHPSAIEINQAGHRSKC